MSKAFPVSMGRTAQTERTARRDRKDFPALPARRDLLELPDPPALPDLQERRDRLALQVLRELPDPREPIAPYPVPLALPAG